MADIVVGAKKKINLFDRVIQSVVILVNMNKMNRAIDEHLSVIHKTEGDEQKLYQENILREIVFVKYQYDIMQRELYKNVFECVDEYVSYINDNYDISKLPSDERELIEFVIETMIKGIESDIDKHMYEFNLVINICKNSYRYFKIIDKIFEKLQTIYDESLENHIIDIKDYIKMYKEIYDHKIKTMVNDVHRSIATEDEYLEYSKLLAAEEDKELNEFVERRALESTLSEKVKEILEEDLKPEEENLDLEDKENEESTEQEEVIDNEIKDIENIEEIKEVVEDIVEAPKKSRRGRKPKSETSKKEEVKKAPKRKVGRPRKEKVNI